MCFVSNLKIYKALYAFLMGFVCFTMFYATIVFA